MNLEKMLEAQIMQIIERDDVETLVAMMSNGFNISDFKYKNHSGFDAVIQYRYDFDRENVGEVIKYLVTECIEDFNLSEDSNQKLGMYAFYDMTRDFLSSVKVVDRDSNKERNATKEELEELFNDLPDIIQDIFRENEGYSNNEDLVDSSIRQDDLNEEDIEALANNVSMDLGNANTKTKENLNNQKFSIIGDSNYKVSSISAYVTLENEETCENHKVTINASNMEDFNNKVNEEIDLLNQKHDENLANSVLEMINTNANFKEKLIQLMKDEQIC